MTNPTESGLSLYQISVPACLQMMKGLKKTLTKAAAFAAEQQKTDQDLLQTRLAPDQFPLVRQVQIACDHAKRIAANLAGLQAPVHEDNETSLAQLQTRIDSVIAYLQSITPEQLQGGQTRDITVLKGTPWERQFSGAVYLSHYGLPNMYFHCTTAYAIVRHLGAPVGKADYLGA